MGEFAGKSPRTDMNPSGRAADMNQPTVGKRTLAEQAYTGMPQPIQAKPQAGAPAAGAPAVGAQPAADLGAAAPPAVELGDQEIGTQTFHEAHVWNLETIEANVVARVEGDPSVQLVAAPGRIFPSRDLSNPDAKENKFRLVFSPTKRGRISATLRVLLEGSSGRGLPVTVTRDEAGNITYSDQTRPPGVPGASWLARKAGDLHGGPSAELRGARKLVEEELMSKPVPSGLIATDSTDGAPNDGR